MRGQRRCILSLAIWGALSCSVNAQNRAANNMSSTIIYTSTVADDRSATTLKVAPDGTGELTVGSNRDRRAQPVGRFEAAVPGAMLRRLLALVASPEFKGMGSVAGLLPGDPYREIRVRQAGTDELVKTVDAGKNVSAVFVEAEQAVQAIIQHLMAYPTVAITMNVDRLPQRVDQRETLLDVILHNVGRTPFRLTAPVEWGKSQTNCELAAVRDVPDSALTLADQKFANLGGSAVVAATKPVEGGFFTLQAGESAAVRFRYAFQWPAGAYRVEITLSLVLTGADGKPLFAGNMAAGPYRIEVAGR